MYEPQPDKSAREVIRETFTPRRVGLLSWAFAALIMGTVGLASFQFGARNQNLNFESLVTAGIPLPPAGDVGTTASTGRLITAPSVEVMQIPQGGTTFSQTDLGQSQIEVLQREISGLRRRLSALQEQNLTYSKRIAALEKQSAVAKLSETSKPEAVHSAGEAASTVPSPGHDVAKAPGTSANRGSKKPATTRSNPTHLAANTKGSPAASLSRQPPQAPPRLIDLYQGYPAEMADANVANKAREPVRIVTLPQAADAPITTGSIPTEASRTLPDTFDPAPTLTALKPTIITPSQPSGRLKGGERQINRSDFGAVIGHYKSSAAAAKAWADFKNQNVERMRDLRPLLLQREGTKGGISLLVGPFANAADAAVACLHLLDATELCHPAIYAGDPLVSSAEFRESAF